MTSRRRFGRIRKLPSGRWQARYPDGSGQDIPASETFASKGDAARWLMMLELRSSCSGRRSQSGLVVVPHNPAPSPHPSVH